MFTVAFQTDEDPFWDWNSSISSVLQDRYCLCETEIDDESILESKLYSLMKYDDICPVSCHYSDSIEYEFIESVFHLSARYAVIDPSIGETHSEVEEHEHEESPSDEIESADHVFDIDDYSSENEFESSE